MDQTQEILSNHITYGSSDSTNQNATSVGKLNYANGGSIQHAWEQGIYNLKTVLHWEDTVGLAGAENQFLKLQLKLGEYPGPACFEEPFWECAELHSAWKEKDPNWVGLKIDTAADPEPVGDYDPAEWNFPKYPNYGVEPWLSVRIENLGTDNKHNDSWFDTRLYTKERLEHPYDLMYVKRDEHFYVGFHARNTRRIAYNVKLHIGEFYLPYHAIKDKRFVRRLTKYGNYSG